MHSASLASILQGLVAIAGNPMRTGLSTLGIVIGVGSVITTLSLTDGMERYLRDQIETNTDVQSVTISSRTTELHDGFPYPVTGFPIFALRDAGELRYHFGGAAEVTMVASGHAIVTSGTAPPHASTVTAVLANYLDFGRKTLYAGRFFTEGESTRNTPVVVLSYKLAKALSPRADPAATIEHVVRVHGRPLTVIGVMPAYTGERGYQVFVASRAAVSTFEGAGLVTPSLIVRAPTIEAVGATMANAEEWLASRYREWRKRVEVTSQVAQLERAQSAMRLLQLLMGFLAGISLVVGGIGIMNILLASVSERTREIGVRKAMGARRRDILCQFLAESVAIAGMGSGIGTGIGVATAFAVAGFVRWKLPGTHLFAAVTEGTLMVSVLSAAIVGLTFGTFPALRASRLAPIDAIRHD